MPDREKIRIEAGEWVARKDVRSLSAEEAAAFQAWFERSPIHAEEFARISEAWADCDLLDELNYVEHIEEIQPAIKSVKVWRRRPILSAMAASVAVMFCGVLYLMFMERAPLQSVSIETAVGEQETFVLVDGSKVTLNTDTAVEVDYSREGRDIRLLRGEAHFDVAESKKRPFSVYADGQIVRAVGTAFTVYLDDDQTVEVTVSEGFVALLAVQQDVRPTPDQGADAPSDLLIELTVGERVLIRESRVEQHEELAVSELNRKLSWRKGLVSFSGMRLEEAISEIGRYSDYEIDIHDPSLNEIPVGGYFKVGEVESFLRALETAFDVEVERVSERHFRIRKI